MSYSKNYKSVTDCFQTQLKSLRLNEYPCVVDKEDDKENQKLEDEVEELLDLIRDKKSPWYEVYDWSKDCDLIREKFIKNKKSINLNSIEQYFTNLRLNDKDVYDLTLKRPVSFFSVLQELVLTCNRISQFDSFNLPSSLKILDLSANSFNNLSNVNLRTKMNIQHLGLSLNSIQSLDQFFNPKYWPHLVSLDLSSNKLYDLVSVVDQLSYLNNLKVLILSGNPLVLLPCYRGIVIDSLPNLFSLDDKPISKEERINYLDFKLYSNILNKQAEIRMHFIQIKNLISPEVPDFEDEPEIFIYKYYLRFNSIDDLSNQSIIGYKIKQEKCDEFEPGLVIDLNEKGLVKLNYKSLIELRDFFQDGTEIELVEKKVIYQLKNFEPTLEDETKKKKKSSKDEKKNDDKKDAKKKKKPLSSILDSYNQVNCEEKVIANFKLELVNLLDGHLREISKTYSVKLKSNLVQSSVSTHKDDVKEKKKKSAKQDDNKASNKKKTDAEFITNENVEPLPFEFNIKFQLLDFDDFKQLKNYFDSSTK